MTYRAKTFYKGRIARDYDRERFGNPKGWLYDYFEKRSIKKALDKFHFKWAVVDCPCGTGRITEYISRLGYPVVGTDISEEMLKVAKARLPHINFFKSDIETIADHENIRKWYTIAVCMRLMGHLPYPKKIQALKSLKHMARFVIATFYFKKWYKRTPDNWYTIEEKELEHLFEICGLRAYYKFPVCRGWSDGVTYLLA